MWLLLTPYTSNPQTTTYKKELSPKSGSRTLRIRPTSPTSNQLDSTSFLPLLPLRKLLNDQREFQVPWIQNSSALTIWGSHCHGENNPKHWHASAIRTHRTWQWTLYPPFIDYIQNHSNISSMLSTLSTIREFDCCGKISGTHSWIHFQMWFDGMIWSSRPARPSIVWWRT
jgi:hypothetical protein